MSTVDLYDSEIESIGKTYDHLCRREGSALSLEGFEHEAKDSFYKIGFVVDIKWWSTDAPGVYIPEIEILDRVTQEKEFDHEKQAHEVTRDVLNLGEGGIMTFDGKVKEPSKSISFAPKSAKE